MVARPERVPGAPAWAGAPGCSSQQARAPRNTGACVGVRARVREARVGRRWRARSGGAVGVAVVRAVALRAQGCKWWAASKAALGAVRCQWCGGVVRAPSRRCGVGGIVVSIAAFQAVDPGSIPGQRSVPTFCQGPGRRGRRGPGGLACFARLPAWRL